MLETDGTATFMADMEQEVKELRCKELNKHRVSQKHCAHPDYQRYGNAYGEEMRPEVQAPRARSRLGGVLPGGQHLQKGRPPGHNESGLVAWPKRVQGAPPSQTTSL